MRVDLVQTQQNAIPRRPLLLLPPPDEMQLIDIVVGAQDRLTIPDRLEHVLHVLLGEQEAHARLAAAAAVRLLLVLLDSTEHVLELGVIDALERNVLHALAAATLAHLATRRAHRKLGRGQISLAGLAVVALHLFVQVLRRPQILDRRRIELRRFYVLQEEAADAETQAPEILLSYASHEEISLAVDQPYDLLSQLAVMLPHRVLQSEEHVEALVLGQIVHAQAIVNIAQFTGANVVGRVNFRNAAVFRGFPCFWLGHLQFIKEKDLKNFSGKNE